MIPRTPVAAIRSTFDHPGPFKAGMCKQKCRQAYGVPSDGSADATEAWGRTKFKHTNGTTAPKGALQWWTGGRSGHGHVAISLGDGRIRTTDLGRSGFWNNAERGDVALVWGLKYVGWSEDIDGVRVITIPTPAPPPRQPSRLAKIRARLLAIANDPKVGPVRRARAKAAAKLLGGLS